MTANIKGGCMLQVSQGTAESLLYEGYQKNVNSSVGLIAGVSFSGTKPPVEETALYQTERHAEVNIDIWQL